MADTREDPHRDAQARPRPPEAALSSGHRLGRYLVLERLGEGGMGVVWSAWDDRLERRVALKLLRADRADPRDEDRLLREARAVAQLNHPHVVAVHDAGVIAGEVFLALELVIGMTLRRWLQQPRTVAEVLEVFLQAGRGLTGAHRAGLVHRDFKPENVLIGNDGRVRVTDFGLARAAHRTSTGPAVPSPETDGSSSMAGTPAYMAPEQIRTGDSDARSDQFAFCVALFEALFGEHPFAPREGGGNGALLSAVLEGSLKLPREPARAPPTILRALTRGMQLDPAKRWPSMEALLAALPDALAAPLRRRRRTRALGAAAVAIALVAVAARWVDRQARICHGSAEQLGRVWNDARRKEVTDALPDDIARVTLRALDARAAAWLSASTDACEATRVRGEQSEAVLALRAGCLERRLDELDALATLLARADEKTARRAGLASQSLSEVKACSDLDALTNLVPAPEDSRLAALRKELAGTVALAAVGNLEAAAFRLENFTGVARQIAWAPLEADALTQQYLVAFEQQPEHSHTLAIDALLAAERGRDFNRVVEVLIDLVFIARALGRFDEALQHGRRAEALLSSRPDALRAARLETYLALTTRAAGRPDEGAIRASRAVALAQSIQPPAPVILAAALSARASEPDGDLARAEKLRAEVFGPPPIDVTSTLRP